MSNDDNFELVFKLIKIQLIVKKYQYYVFDRWLNITLKIYIYIYIYIHMYTYQPIDISEASY